MGSFGKTADDGACTHHEPCHHGKVKPTRRCGAPGRDSLPVRTKERMDSMNIGAAARESGVSARMIRHYESVGLLPAAARTSTGYRKYTLADVHVLRFIRHSRELGFSIDQIQELLSLWQNRTRRSREVKALVRAHVQELNVKLDSLQAVKAALENLSRCCRGDDRPDCPIIEALAGGRSNVAAARASARR
jgi:Cu(I)-responsive transcriptional regulator